MAAEGVLVLEHGAADVAHAGLLLVGRDDVALGAQLGAVGTDQLALDNNMVAKVAVSCFYLFLMYLVAVLHVLVEVALALEHLVAVVAGPVVLALLGVIIPHVSREVPEIRAFIKTLTNKY